MKPTISLAPTSSPSKHPSVSPTVKENHFPALNITVIETEAETAMSTTGHIFSMVFLDSYNNPLGMVLFLVIFFLVSGNFTMHYKHATSNSYLSSFVLEVVLYYFDCVWCILPSNNNQERFVGITSRNRRFYYSRINKNSNHDIDSIPLPYKVHDEDEDEDDGDVSLLSENKIDRSRKQYYDNDSFSNIWNNTSSANSSTVSRRALASAAISPSHPPVGLDSAEQLFEDSAQNSTIDIDEDNDFRMDFEDDGDDGSSSSSSAGGASILNSSIFSQSRSSIGSNSANNSFVNQLMNTLHRNNPVSSARAREDSSSDQYEEDVSYKTALEASVSDFHGNRSENPYYEDNPYLSYDRGGVSHSRMDEEQGAEPAEDSEVSDLDSLLQSNAADEKRSLYSMHRKTMLGRLLASADDNRSDTDTSKNHKTV